MSDEFRFLDRTEIGRAVRDKGTVGRVAKALKMPVRTLQDWCVGRRFPPAYVRSSVLDALKALPHQGDGRDAAHRTWGPDGKRRQPTPGEPPQPERAARDRPKAAPAPKGELRKRLGGRRETYVDREPRDEPLQRWDTAAQRWIG